MNMQIVIDIPKEEYERLTYIDILKLRTYIENGTPLPKGHGDLIDRQELLKSTLCKTFGLRSVDIENAPTIIGEDVTRLLSLEQEPCEDTISRDELLKAIDTWDKFGCDADTKLVPYQDHYIPYIHYDDVVKCIKGMPSVTPQPKIGHWIENYAKDGCGELYSHWICSECGRSVGFNYADIEDVLSGYPYCHCGAKMIESEVENETYI
jgi:hypothetical protein